MQEIWRDIPNYEELYQASNFGFIRRIHKKGTTHTLKGVINKDGYYRVHLSKNSEVKNFYVHRLIAETFIPNPNNLPFINHKKELEKLNNKIDNLEWCNSKYNANYGTRNQRVAEKIKKPIYQIKDNHIIKKWDSSQSASEVLHISRGNIVSCCRGKRKTAGGYIWRYCNE